MEKQEFYFLSNNKETIIHAIRWVPNIDKIKGIIQIVHGMAEFIDRYDDFASTMARQGYLVVGHDHLGHGTSISKPDDYGFFSKEDGNKNLLADIHTLRLKLHEEYPEAPYFLLGHSMGSFLTRQYICEFGEGLAGVIIMGTGEMPNSVLKVGKGITSVLAGVMGWHHRSPFIDKIAFGSYNKHFQPQRTEKDWLTRDEKIVDLYLADERCTFIFTLNGFYNLFFSIQEAQKQERLEGMPKKLPILLISGKEDPVGSYGKAVRKLAARFKKNGMKYITLRLYSHGRHEVLNELNRVTVYEDIGKWLNKRLKTMKIDN